MSVVNNKYKPGHIVEMFFNNKYCRVFLKTMRKRNKQTGKACFNASEIQTIMMQKPEYIIISEEDCSYAKAVIPPNNYGRFFADSNKSTCKLKGQSQLTFDLFNYSSWNVEELNLTI